MSSIEENIKNQMKNTLKETNFPSLGELYRGKVRDNYIRENQRIIIATDRLSAFDRVITTIPFKGQLLNQVSSFWFEKTKNIVRNHIIDVPDPNVAIVHQCQTLPVEIIVRAYITGTAWRKYLKGEKISGIKLPSGLKKNQLLEEILICIRDVNARTELLRQRNTIVKDIHTEFRALNIEVPTIAEKGTQMFETFLEDLTDDEGREAPKGPFNR